ncbi:hypothetical protein [Ferrigenium kumadai]|uniref:hypothetical protein n=1 Tax=Ferrigenium kumadai TaxID=1682490 RepID=UPI001BB35BF3|nr:hypothetical protein [Ferrigenium kumadai]
MPEAFRAALRWILFCALSVSWPALQLTPLAMARSLAALPVPVMVRVIVLMS